MAGRGEGEELPYVSYHPGGSDETLRPTLMTVSDGRSYRKMTEATFGPKRKEGGTARPNYSERDDYSLGHPHPFNGTI